MNLQNIFIQSYEKTQKDIITHCKIIVKMKNASSMREERNQEPRDQ